tara:strand:- start:7 stop:1167 length:1161 start_codon:yes stop_codon:yes gene_type:complete
MTVDDSAPVSGGSPQQGLLPAGLSDLLHPQAAQDMKSTRDVMACFADFGYVQVKPPLVEFEETLLGEGPGASLSKSSFRLLDPVSHQMMALRADMTAQVARISGTRLAHVPRPLRLAYSGEVMRVVPDVLNPERQLVQAGAEIIGRDDEQAAAEMILLGVRALTRAGISGLTVDLGVPRLVGLLLDGVDDDARATLGEAVRNRDITALSAHDSVASAHLAALCTQSGGTAEALAAVGANLPQPAADYLSVLLNVVEMLSGLMPDVALTLDPLDSQGFDYHTSISFSIFGQGLRGAVARGGAYVTGYGEPAVGISLYMDRILRALNAPDELPRLYISAEAGLASGLSFADRGRQVVFGSVGVNADQEALSLGCQFILRHRDSAPEEL